MCAYLDIYLQQYFGQRLKGAAPKYWSNYTTPVIIPEITLISSFREHTNRHNDI